MSAIDWMMKSLDAELTIDDIVNDVEEFHRALGDDYDEHDTDLVDMGKKLQVCLSGIRRGKTSSSYASMDIDTKIKVITCITNYKLIMTPSSDFFSCCSKKKRQLQHEKRSALNSLQLIESIFLIQAHDVGYKCDLIVKECHYSQKFADILRQISSTTSIFEIKNSIDSKSQAKEKLSVLLSRLEIYKEEFLSSKGNENSTMESTPTRFRNIQVALATHPSSSTSYVSYKKANKMLHDVATLGTSLLLFKIDEKLKEIEDYIKLLKNIRLTEVSELDMLEVNGFTYSLIEENEILKMKRDSERMDDSIHGKLVGASFEWSELKERVSSSSFLSAYFGSADDDIENLFSSASFMSTNVGSNVIPKSKTVEGKNDNTKSSKNVSDFFNNIKLPHNKKPQTMHAEEPPIYNLKTQQPVDDSYDKPKRLISKKAKRNALSPGIKMENNNVDGIPQRISKKTATAFESPLTMSHQAVESSALSLDVIDFEDGLAMSSSSALLSDSSSDSSRKSFSTALKSRRNNRQLGDQNNSKTKTIFSSNFNAKLNQMSGSISRTASKASAKVSETKEKMSDKVSSSAPSRMLKNSYTSLKNKSDVL